MSDWREHYQSKTITPEEAAALVKQGDRVVFPVGRETYGIGLALCARKDELSDIEIVAPSAQYHFPWYDAGWEDTFKVVVMAPNATCQEAFDERRCDMSLSCLIPDPSSDDDRPPDVVLVEISAPDEHGFCSFGASVWEKRERIQQGKLVIGEVNPNLIRTYGDNYVHVSEIGYFVEHVASGGAPGTGSLAGRALREPEPRTKTIVENVSSQIKDGDTLQIGVGRTNEFLARLGAFDNKHDLGFHSEATPPGIIKLVREGVITGKCKTVNPGKVVVTAIGGDTREEMLWVNMNPLFYLVGVRYLEDIRVIAAHDNFVAINQALFIDLSGQIVAESIGTRIVATAGGQIPFVIGALLSKGGRAIHVMPSTAQNGKVSRIVPVLPQGSVVTIQRNCADCVVTEYGVAHLKGKSLRRRAEELIAVAHPDFRAELKEAVRKAYWP